MTGEGAAPTVWNAFAAEPDYYKRTVTLFQFGADGHLVIDVGDLPEGKYDITVTVETSREEGAVT